MKAHGTRKFSGAALLAAAAGTFAALATAAGAETLKLGNEGVNPPFAMVGSDGQLSGLEPDLAREMCKRMNVECEFVVMDFQALIPSLLQGKYDALVSNLSQTPERKERLLFTTRIVANPVTFVVPADSDYEFTPEGLAGKGIKVGLQRGGANSKFIQDKFGDSIEYAFYDNPDQAHLDLLAGRINMLFEPKISVTLSFLDKPEGKGWKLGGGDYLIGQDDLPEAERGNAWVVAKDKEALVEKMNTALISMVEDCTYTKIRKQYISVATLPEDAACETK